MTRENYSVAVKAMGVMAPQRDHLEGQWSGMGSDVWELEKEMSSGMGWSRKARGEANKTKDRWPSEERLRSESSTETSAETALKRNARLSMDLIMQRCEWYWHECLRAKQLLQWVVSRQPAGKCNSLSKWFHLTKFQMCHLQNGEGKCTRSWGCHENQVELSMWSAC